MLYSCQELAKEAQDNAQELRALEALMAKAGADASGRLVGNMAYGPEILQLRGRLDQIHKTAAEKDCNLSPGGSGVGGRQGEQTRR
jgi:hypothetical protein